MREFMAAYATLARLRLAVGAPVFRVRVSEAGSPRSYLFDGEFAPDNSRLPAEGAALIAHEVRGVLRTGEIGSVTATVNCVGEVSGGEQQAVHSNLFRLSVDVYADYVAAELVTFSDAWMPYDLRGRPQPETYAANQPRLAAALRDLSMALDSEIDPGDPTYFGRPTATGIDNFFDPGGAPSDVWTRFEE
ncbi:hypothetical protein [Nocardia crassostreae]|uniref:hypothetical protein n=1 Tax=Nocardia crassostreae TaxID=53428 RepID=UPI0012F7BEBC|nr:hypothetical protein [Nocardia crassostreae]